MKTLARFLPLLASGLLACGGSVQPGDAETDAALHGIPHCATGHIAAVSANGAQEGNPAGHAIDGNFSTRWSNEGDGAFITADLGSAQTLCGAAIGWYQGTTRTSAYDLSVSSDGKSFSRVASGKSSGKSNGLQALAFTLVNARYLRVTVHGNSVNDWDSITELAVGVSRGALDAGTGTPPPPTDAGTGTPPPPTDAGTGTPPRTDAGTGTPSGWPDATNTGVPAGVTLTPYTGPTTITVDNTVIDAADIKSTLDIKAKNVVIKRSRIATGDYFGVSVDSGSATIEDCELSGMNAASIVGDNVTILRVNIHDMVGDGMKIGSNFVLQDSYVHDFNPCSDCHSDGAQMEGPTTNVTIRHNHMDGHPKAGAKGDVNSALFLQPDLGDSNGAGPVIVDGNLFEGGGWTVYVDKGHGGLKESGYHFTNNRWTRTGGYGPFTGDDTADIVEWTNNAFTDGTAIHF